MGKVSSLVKKKNPWYINLLGLGFGVLFLISTYYIMKYGLWKLFFLIIPASIVIKRIFFPSDKSKFLKMQGILPTSKAGSVAMGMIEIVGDLEQIEPLFSPYFSQECIGYFYRIEEESKSDDDGRTSYHTIHFEQKIGIFSNGC